MTFSPFGIVTEKSKIGLLYELTISTLLSNSRPKYQRTKWKKIRKRFHLGHQNPFQADRDQPLGVKYGFIKGEAIRLRRANSSKETFEVGLLNFKQHLKKRGYPENIIEMSLPGVKFTSRQSALYIYTKAKRSRSFISFCHNVPPGI